MIFFSKIAVKNFNLLFLFKIKLESIEESRPPLSNIEISCPFGTNPL